MREPRPALCMALDPIPSASASGTAINRHCMLPAGHTSYHQSRDIHGDLVHEWCWWQEQLVLFGEPPSVQPDLFGVLLEQEV